MTYIGQIKYSDRVPEIDNFGVLTPDYELIFAPFDKDGSCLYCTFRNLHFSDT